MIVKKGNLPNVLILVNDIHGPKKQDTNTSTNKNNPGWQTVINCLWSYLCSSQQKLKDLPAIVQCLACFARHLRKHHKLFHTINYKYSGVLELGKSGGLFVACFFLSKLSFGKKRAICLRRTENHSLFLV